MSLWAGHSGWPWLGSPGLAVFLPCLASGCLIKCQGWSWLGRLDGVALFHVPPVLQPAGLGTLLWSWKVAGGNTSCLSRLGLGMGTLSFCCILLPEDSHADCPETGVGRQSYLCCERIHSPMAKARPQGGVEHYNQHHDLL